MSERAEPDVHIVPVDASNWRAVAQLRVTPEQEPFVAAPTYYLCLCHYGTTWKPLAVMHDGETVGFLMWGVDPADDSTWLGGIIIDAKRQGRGLGAGAVRAAIQYLNDETGAERFALSYEPSNARARRLYARLGFVETGEEEDDEIVARYTLAG